MNTNIVLLGVLFLGGFVGLLLGLVVQFTKNISLKLAAAVIGAALGGAPILFMTGLRHEKWMYPIGLVLGFLWVRLITARQVIARRPRKVERTGWLIGWLDTVAIVVVTGGIVIAAAFVTDSATEDIRTVTREEMPCRWAWVFLGRYSHKGDGGYEVGGWFKPAQIQNFPSPTPKPGNDIVLTAPRELLITGFGTLPKDQKCGDNIFDPPWGDRPSTHNSYVAGKLPANIRVHVNQVQLMPFETAEPTYVWALIGPPE